MANDKQPSFPERVQAMQSMANNLLATANLLRKFAQDIEDEAERMAAAQKRFAERRADKRRKISPHDPEEQRLARSPDREGGADADDSAGERHPTDLT